MKMQVRQPPGIARVAAQADGLSGNHAITDLDQGAVRGEVGIGSDRSIGVTNLDPVGLTLPGLTVNELHSYLSHHSRACGGHGCADRHDKVIGVLVGTPVAAS